MRGVVLDTSVSKVLMPAVTHLGDLCLRDNVVMMEHCFTYMIRISIHFASLHAVSLGKGAAQFLILPTAHSRHILYGQSLAPNPANIKLRHQAREQ